jgi:acetyl-CoA carboxylase biotin carboxylase subunit
VAIKAGFPVLLKACAGGGGRGMKIVSKESEFEQLFTTAQREVEAAFGDGHLLIEKYLPRVRHIEVQLIGDQHKNLAHLGIRDCTMQRRYQKIIEECQSGTISKKLIDNICHAAVQVGNSVNYSSVGTVEFLVDMDTNKFYFIEMNTRLQVEHPVTEMVFNVDLVREQIRVAAGQELSFKQVGLIPHGHAIEVRVNAEHPRTLVPSPGLVNNYHPPGGQGVRVDSALYSGYSVQPYYDSLISKLIVHADTREACIKKLLVALDEYLIEGIQTNIELHRRLLSHPKFASGDFTTKFLEGVNLFADDEKTNNQLEKAAN